MAGASARVSAWRRTAVATAAYALAVWTGLGLMVQPVQFAIFWPAAGLAVAALLRQAPAGWPILLGSFFLAAVADIGARLLESLGYVVTVFTDPDEAAAHFLAGPARVDVLVTDLTMPGMTGTRLAERVRRIRPDLPVVIATGVTAAVTVGPDAGFVVLAKPYTRHTLGTAVGGLLQAVGPIE